MPEFTDTERAILREAQGDLPDDPQPYARIAEKVGVSEAEVISLLQRLIDEGVIRRYGASLKHQKAGYGGNVMVAWRCDDEAARDAAGERMAEHSSVSHCYHRPPPEHLCDPASAGQAAWPYALFTMVHGRDHDDCRRVVQELSEATSLTDYALLYSVRELKKSSMTYF